MEVSGLTLKYDLHYHTIPETHKECIHRDENINVETVILNHRIPCCGFIFKENPPERKYVPEAGKSYNIPVKKIPDIKKGRDYISPSGKVIKNEELTEPGHRPRKYVYITDTIYLEHIIPRIKNADLLYHEATFSEQLKERADQTFHTTTAQAAEMAKKSNARKLLLGHFSAKYKELDFLLEEARRIFPNSYLAIEGERFSIAREQ